MGTKIGAGLSVTRTDPDFIGTLKPEEGPGVKMDQTIK